MTIQETFEQIDNILHLPRRRFHHYLGKKYDVIPYASIPGIVHDALEFSDVG